MIPQPSSKYKKRAVLRPIIVQPDDPNVRFIPLTQGQVAVVDASDYDWLMQWNWCALRVRDGVFYASRTEDVAGKKYTVSMAREIMGHPEGLAVDHRSGTLDNRRSNLRVATFQQNSCNRIPHSGRKFKGVFWHKKANKWRSLIRVDYKLKSLGMFTRAEDAARAYDIAAREFHGEFAWTNFPTKPKQLSAPAPEVETTMSLALKEDW